MQIFISVTQGPMFDHPPSRRLPEKAACSLEKKAKLGIHPPRGSTAASWYPRSNPLTPRAGDHVTLLVPGRKLFFIMLCLEVIFKTFLHCKETAFLSDSNSCAAEQPAAGPGWFCSHTGSPRGTGRNTSRSELHQGMRIWGFLCQLFLDTFLLHKYRTRDRKGLGHFLKTIPQPRRANTT